MQADTAPLGVAPKTGAAARGIRPWRRWQVRLLVLALIWGWSFLFIRVGDRGLSPFAVAFSRMAFGTAVVLAILWLGRGRLPRSRTVWAHLALAALLNNAIPYTLFAIGELHVTSVTAGILNAATPLLTAPIALLVLPGERLTGGRALGLGIGFAGVVLVLAGSGGAQGASLLGSAACLGAALSYAVGYAYTRRFLASRPEGPIALAGAQLIWATAMTLVAALMWSTTPARLTLPVVASVAALGLGGTGVALILNYGIIRDAGATAASTVTFLVPAFATLVGVLVLGEPLRWNAPAGLAVILLGAYLVQGRQIPATVRGGHG